jgi:cytidylate kinase
MLAFRTIAAENKKMQSRQHIVIAIDGPAASGKSSVARELARRFGFVYVNSGAMYRAVTWRLLQCGIDPRDRAAIERQVGTFRIRSEVRARQSCIFVDEIDPGDHLRDAEVNQNVSLVSSVPRVRQVLVEKMREYARDDDLVMEGRDIGSVVFPNTPFKFYIDASPEIRSQRRAAQGQSDEIASRDRADSSRPTSPLIVARDAEVIDTSKMSINQVVDEIVARLNLKNLTIENRNR